MRNLCLVPAIATLIWLTNSVSLNGQTPDVPVIQGISDEAVFSKDYALDLYEYLSPKPYSLYHNPETVILIRFGEEIDVLSLRDDVLIVTGEISGSHQGKFTISRDHLTLIFTPGNIFSFNEKVTLHLQKGLRTRSGKLLPEFSYWFIISELSDSNIISVPVCGIDNPERLSESSVSTRSAKGVQLSFSDFNFPDISLSNNPAEGNILTTLEKGLSDYIYIFDNKAVPVYVRIMPHKIINLIPHNSGKLTYYDSYLKGFIVLDSCMTTIDTLYMKNQYRTDSHEILLLDNGHTILFGIDPKIMDMNKIVAGGNPAATVNGIVIQELDEDKNLIFQWRSWDYFNITDSYSDLLYSVVDYVHCNSLDADTDNTLIISSRNMNEVTKISRLTGQIIWRLGGKNNEFIFENDPRQFAGQHTAIKQKNGTLTLFDNGTGLTPRYSRGIEYEIDEINKKVKLIHEYRHDPEVYANVSGNLQRLNNGNTFIYWGSGMDQSEKLFCEYDIPGNIIFEARFGLNINLNFRAYRSKWEPEIFSFSSDTLIFERTGQNDPLDKTLEIRNNSGKRITITSFHHNNLGFDVTGIPVTIEPGSGATVSISSGAHDQNKVSDKIIFCQETDSVLVARSLFVLEETALNSGTDRQDGSGFKVRPNPGNGLFFVESEQTGEFSLKVIDISGKTIWENDVKFSDFYQIDLSTKPDGLYLLYIEELSSGKINKIRLIKE